MNLEEEITDSGNEDIDVSTWSEEKRKISWMREKKGFHAYGTRGMLERERMAVKMP